MPSFCLPAYTISHGSSFFHFIFPFFFSLFTPFRELQLRVGSAAHSFVPLRFFFRIFFFLPLSQHLRMSGRQLAGVGAVGVLTIVGVVGGTRWRRVEVRRAELNREYEQIISETRAFNEDRITRDRLLAEKEAKALSTHEAIDVLWRDRLQRYVGVNEDLHAYVKALPEAIGAVKGLTHHYRYMTEAMPKFIGFDIACSKVHNLSLMLEHGRAVGIHRVAGTIKEMFAAEPLVQAVCDQLTVRPQASCPSSTTEASTTFLFCMSELDRAIAAVATKHAASLETPPEPTPGTASDAIRVLVKTFHLDALSTGQRRLVERRKDLERMLLHAHRQLHTTEDVRAALDYTQQLEEELMTRAPRRLQWFGLHKKADAFMVAIRADPEVRKALAQISVWREAATTLLVHRQAEEALRCYHLLLAESLTKVNAVR